MTSALEEDLDQIIATVCDMFAHEGQALEVAIFADATFSIQDSSFDNWDGGIYGYAVTLQVSQALFRQIGENVEKVEKRIQAKADVVARRYENQHFDSFRIVSTLNSDPDWRDKARSMVSGQGLTNQGRVRSDNLAPRQVEGLLFRSQPEIHLYRAFRSTGIVFAPLAVFIRGGQTYRRIEPDFVIIKDGLMMVVEVDGDTVHLESPQVAHERTSMLGHEGAHIERVNANECDTPDKAKQCAARLLQVLEKHRTNR